MKKFIYTLSFLLSILLFAGETKKATYEEVKKSIELIEKFIKEGKEELIPVFNEAIEIEKRATTPYLADKIKKKICKTTKIKEEVFEIYRNKFSFFDIAIAWAINCVKGVPIEKVLEEREIKEWDEIIKNDYKVIAEKIKELNPKLKSF
ncbi:MAG: hypothetical protein NC926_06975 [Candidatus Omnitrophica bacterium]|nr:hypothetical protein [Candidatus Omnitrophota bacterium]MCM8807666.1 hypothetical protein [Candidatus Omnitrophota bacterium]